MKLDYKQYLIITIFILIVLAMSIYFNRAFNSIGTSLFVFSLAVLPISLMLFFLKKQIFTTWKKFAIYFISLSIIWIIIAPEGCGGGFGGFGGCVFDKETTAMFTAGLFFFISLLIIAIKSWKLRKPE